MAQEPDVLAGIFDAVWGADPEMPDCIRPISWLRSAVEDLRRRGPAEDEEDPEAFWQMVREVEDLEQKASAAISKATLAQED